MRPDLLALVALGAAPAIAHAATAPVACTEILPDRPTVRHEVALGGRLTAYVDDRYGGYVAKQTHGAYEYVLRFRRGAHVLGRAERAGAVDGSTATIDGRATRNPFYANSKLAVGEHVFAFTIRRAGGGAPVMLRFGFTVGACGVAQGYGALTSVHGGGLALDAWSGRNERGGNPALTALGLFAGRGVRVQIPASTRGHAVGQMLLRGAGYDPAAKPLALRVDSRGSSTLLHRGALRVRLLSGHRGFLQITGMPARTTSVALRLIGRAGRSLVTGPRLSPLFVSLGSATAGVGAFNVRPLCLRCSVGL